MAKRRRLEISRCALVAALLTAAASAGAVERLSPQTGLSPRAPESWAMRYFTLLTQESGFGPPALEPAGTVGVGLELGQVPQLSAAQETVGFSGTKREDLNHLPLFGRVRFAGVLPGQVVGSLGYVPPVRIGGVKPNLVSGSLGRSLQLGPLRVGLSIFGQYGSVQGAFTCSEGDAAAGSDPARNPYDCLEPSADRIQMRYFGAELGAAYPLPILDGLEPFVTVEGSRFFSRFDVHARYGNIDDGSQLFSDTNNVAGTVGLGLPLGRGVRLRAETFYAPLQVRRFGASSDSSDPLVNFRALVEYRRLP